MINGSGVFLKYLVITGARGELELVNGFRIEQVVLAILAPLVLATGIKCVTGRWSVGECVLMPAQSFAGNLLDASRTTVARIGVERRPIELDRVVRDACRPLALQAEEKRIHLDVIAADLAGGPANPGTPPL